MTVSEKLDFIEKRRKHVQRKQRESGITNEIKERLHKRGMVVADMKYLPASDLKSIICNDVDKFKPKPRTSISSPANELANAEDFTSEGQIDK